MESLNLKLASTFAAASACGIMLSSASVLARKDCIDATALNHSLDTAKVNAAKLGDDVFIEAA